MAVEERDKAPLADMLAAAHVARMLAGGLPFDALMADVRTRHYRSSPVRLDHQVFVINSHRCVRTDKGLDSVR